MPWSMSNVPSFAKNKSKQEQEIAVNAANAVLQKGGSEEDAIFASIAAVKAYNRRESQKKALDAPKRVTPAHISTLLQKAIVEAPEQVTEKNFGIRREFLGKNALPTGVDRNLVSANFNEKSELTLYFDTGEKIVTDSVKQLVENYVNIVNEQKQISSSGLLVYITTLSDKNVSISSNTHGLVELVSIYFTKNNKEISVDWVFDENKNIIINSNVDLLGVTLTAYGS